MAILLTWNVCTFAGANLVGATPWAVPTTWAVRERPAIQRLASLLISAF